MRLLPRPARGRRIRQIVRDVMEPPVPFRRHLGCLGLALVEHPAPLPALHAAALDERRAFPLAVIAIAGAVAADQLAAPPGKEPRPDRHETPFKDCKRACRNRKKCGGLWHSTLSVSSARGLASGSRQPGSPPPPA